MHVVSGNVLDRWTSLSDEQIVAQVLCGQTALFEVLMRRHNRKVYRAVRSILGDESAVEAVMQQAYVSAYAHLAGFRGAASVSTWLVRIAVHEAFARLRRSRRFVDAGAGDLVGRMPSQERGPEEQASDRELRHVLERAIDGLPPAYRSVFVLREVEGLDTRETADCLGLSAENVKVRLHRARARLREAIEEDVGEELGGVFAFRAPRCDRVAVAVLARI